MLARCHTPSPEWPSYDDHSAVHSPSAVSGGCRRLWPRSASSLAFGILAEVGANHHWVSADGIRGAFSNLLAMVQHHYAVRNVHHDPHIVLDEHNRGAPLIVYIQDEARHVFLFFEIDRKRTRL